jgi:hypothetical protein
MQIDRQMALLSSADVDLQDAYDMVKEYLEETKNNSPRTGKRRRRRNNEDGKP